MAPKRSHIAHAKLLNAKRVSLNYFLTIKISRNYAKYFRNKMVNFVNPSKLKVKSCQNLKFSFLISSYQWKNAELLVSLKKGWALSSSRIICDTILFPPCASQVLLENQKNLKLKILKKKKKFFFELARLKRSLFKCDIKNTRARWIDT